MEIKFSCNSLFKGDDEDTKTLNGVRERCLQPNASEEAQLDKLPKQEYTLDEDMLKEMEKDTDTFSNDLTGASALFQTNLVRWQKELMPSEKDALQDLLSKEQEWSEEKSSLCQEINNTKKTLLQKEREWKKEKSSLCQELNKKKKTLLHKAQDWKKEKSSLCEELKKKKKTLLQKEQDWKKENSSVYQILQQKKQKLEEKSSLCQTLLQKKLDRKKEKSSLCRA